jgi:hypothetical protein
MRILDPRPGTWRDVLDSMRARSALLNTLHERVSRRYHSEVSTRVFTAAHERDSRGWKRVKRQLCEAAALLRERDIGFGVVLLPTAERRGEHLSSHDAYEVVSAFCRSASIPALDIEPLFRESDPASLIVHPLDPHLNAKAYAIVGAAVGGFVVEAGLLGRDRPRTRAPMASGGTADDEMP